MTKYLFLLLCFVCTTTKLNAQSCTEPTTFDYFTINNGPWTSGSTWNTGTVPSGSSKKIRISHAVTFSSTFTPSSNWEIVINGGGKFTAGQIQLNNSGSKIIINGGSLDVTNGDLQVNTSSASICAFNACINLTNGNFQFEQSGTVMIFNKTGINIVNGNLQSKSNVSGSDIRVWVKSNFERNAGTWAGSTVSTWYVGGSVTGFSGLPTESSSAVATSMVTPCDDCNAGTTGPAVQNRNNICPATTVNLNTAHTGTIPSGSSLVWFTNNTHTGTALSGTQVTAAGAGTYYAFYYDSTNNCYSPVSNTVTITINTTTVPTITTTPATCFSSGTATISNYDNTAAYTFSPSGPTVASGGIISGMTAGTNYTVTATKTGCVSSNSSSFSIEAQLASPTATPAINSAANYSAINSAYTIPCGSSPTANLSTLTTSNLPASTTLTWHSASPATDANRINPVTAVTGVTRKIYAAFRNTAGCYSPTKMITIYGPICATADDYTSILIMQGVATTLPTIFSNDSYNGTAFTMPNPNIEVIEELWSSFVTINPNGTLAVSPLLSAGTYTLYYKICDKDPDAVSGSSCSLAEVKFKIVSCTNPSTGGTPDGYTQTGISSFEGFAGGWPGNIPNGFIAIESKAKGFVITRTTASAIPAAGLVEGMLIYDTTDNCVKLYNGAIWHCIEKACNTP